MKKNIKNSPLLSLGQGIHELLRYESIAAAGRPRNLTGEAIVQLGTLFSQMDLPGEEAEGKKEVEEKKPEDNKINVTPIDYVATLPEVGTKLPPKKVYQDPKDKKDSVGGKVIMPNTGIGGTQFYPGQEQTYPEGPRMKDDAYLYAEDSEYNQGALVDYKPFNFFSDFYNPQHVGSGDITKMQSKDAQYGPGIGKRLSTSPFQRLETDHPDVFEHLQGLRYNTKVMGDSPLRRMSHALASPFLQTDQGPNLEKVDFRYMKRAVMPEYAKGSLGSAAAEGYNLAIDRFNYKQAVKKDYDNELTDQMGELEVGLDKTNPNYKKDLLELVSNKKSEIAKSFADYTSGKITKLEYENAKDAVKADINSIAQASGALRKITTEFVNDKGTHDLSASKPEIASFYNTLEKNPDAFTVKSINGVDHYVGTTLQGNTVKIPVSKIANGMAGFRLVPKYDYSKASNAALKAMQNIDVEAKTGFGFGRTNLSPDDPNLKSVAIAELMNSIGSDESRLRSVMANKFGYDYDKFEQMLGDDKEANMQEMLRDAAEEIYKEDIVPRYFPKSKTIVRDPSKIGIAPKPPKSTAGERQRAEIQKRFQNLPNPTSKNIKTFTKELQPGKSVGQGDEGNWYVFNVKGEAISEPIDFSNPNIAKAQLARHADTAGFEFKNEDTSFSGKEFLDNYYKNKSN